MIDSSNLFWISEVDPGLLQSERRRILPQIRRAVPYASVMEVGSTTVPGVIGKQDVDFAVRSDRRDFRRARADLDFLYERNPTQLSNSEYQGYSVDSVLDVSIQLFVSNSQYDAFERFLKILSSDSVLRNSYNELKRDWHGKPMGGYRLAKAEFIQSAIGSMPG